MMSFVEPNIAPDRWWLGNYSTFLLGIPIFRCENDRFRATLAILDVTMVFLTLSQRANGVKLPVEGVEVTLQGSCSIFFLWQNATKKDHLKRRSFGKHHGFPKLFL